MAQNTKLFLDGVGELDLGVDVPIALNFSVTEIQDISKRSSAFSKTIILPGTKQNLEKLGFLFNVNIEFADATFDINRKVQAFVYQNDSVVLDGFFKLINVKKLSPSDVSYEQQIEFEAVVFGGQASFFDFVKQYDINSLNLSIYDHTLTWDIISGTTGNTYLDGYKYIWHYTTQDRYNVGDFRPAMFIRTIWDKIFVEAGYSYYMEPNFQTNVFNKLLLPTNARDLLITREEQLSRSAKVGINDPLSIWGDGNVTTSSYFANLGGIQYWGTRAVNLYNGAQSVFNNGFYFNFDIVEFDNDTDVCYYNGSYTPFDVANFQFICQKNGNYDVTIDLNGKFEIILTSDFSNRGLAVNELINPNFFVVLELIKYPVGSNLFDTIGTMSKIFYIDEYLNFTTQSDGNQGLVAGTYDFDFKIATQPVVVSLLEGERLKVRSRIIYDYTTFTSISTPQLSNPDLTATIYGYAGNNCSEYSTFRVQAIPNNATEGDIFTMSSCLPQKVKMVDFIKSLATMFNLYIDVDPNDPYRLIIKPRNVYYNYNVNDVVDWTRKVDYQQQYNVELLSELQDRTLNFTYKPSKDEVNTNYFEGTKFYYGQYKVNFDNDFLSSEQKIEVLFEPTPLVINGNGSLLSDVTIEGNSFIVPYLIYGKESLPKILIDGGVIYTDQTYVISGNTTDPSGTLNINFYSYAGHFDDPFVPTFDINFNLNEEYFYNEILDNLTTNNLYNTYWSDYINLISNSRLLTAYVNLNELDIKNLRFDVLYWIEDSYWLLNKVIDYNCNETQLTKCEFIKSINTPFFTTTIQKPNLVPISKPIKNIKPWVGIPGKEDIRDNMTPGNTGNVNNGNSSIIKGFYNKIDIGTRSFSIFGSSNLVGQNVKVGSINGNENIIGGDTSNINVIGNRNNIEAGCSNITMINCEDVTIPANSSDIFVQNLKNRTITKSDVSFVNPYVYFYQGYRINNSDILDGGEDIVFNSQNEFVDNVLDGLLDETFMMGVDGAQIIDGTYNNIDF